MAIALAQQWAAPTSGSLSSSSSATGSATTAGNLLLAYVFTEGQDVAAVTITDDGDNTWTEAGHAGDANSQGVMWLFYCAGAAAVTSITANLTDAEDAPLVNEHVIIGAVEFSGVQASSPMADADTAVPIAPATLQATTTPAAAGDLVFGVGGLALTNRIHELVGTTYTPSIIFRGGGKNVVSGWALAGDTTDTGPTWEITSGTNNSAIALITATFQAGEGGPTPLSVAAGADQSVYVGQSATVGATASGGTAPYTYAWTKVSGPAGSFLNANQANTTFTPSGGAGTYVLRCIATDSTSTTAQDDLVLTVSQAPSLVTVASVNDATGWTPTGGTVLQVLSDTSDSTLVTSQENPTEQVLDVVMGPAVVAEGQHWTQRVRMRRSSSSTSGTATGYLYVGSTLISTVTGKTIPGSLGDVDFTFPNADVSAITGAQWTAGVRFVVEVTAA